MPEADPFQLPERLLRHPIFLMVRLIGEAYRKGNPPGVPKAPAVQPIPLRLPHYAVLVSLEEFGPASQKQVCDRLGFDPSDMVRFVDGLEGAGYLTREKDKNDRRRHALCLTDVGRTVLREREGYSDQMTDRFFSVLSPEERSTLRDLLRRTFEHHRGTDGHSR